ncbi:MAG TPA: hypothetical protein VGS22_21300 [Thermoanaerobaculia bacterium]|jgi:hypothetical protein|nr:hypothetical protein [Thermoanaerobaculia bacterium]
MSLRTRLGTAWIALAILPGCLSDQRAARPATNKAILPLASGSLSVRAVQSSGTAHVVLNVVGYFQ